MTGDSLDSKSPGDKNKNKNKKLFILLGVLVLMIIIVIIVAVQGKRTKVNTNKATPVKTNQVKNNTKSPQSGSANSKSTSTLSKENLALQNAVTVVPGANPISKENKVLTTSGAVTKTDVSPASALAPEQTLAVSQKSLPSSVIKLTESAAQGFVPNSFTVNAGTPVTISITNKESGRSSTLVFTDPSLSAVILGAGPSETRAITFNAPTKPGNYKFIDGIPGHSASGVMVVK